MLNHRHNNFELYKKYFINIGVGYLQGLISHDEGDGTVSKGITCPLGMTRKTMSGCPAVFGDLLAAEL